MQSIDKLRTKECVLCSNAPGRRCIYLRVFMSQMKKCNIQPLLDAAS